MRRLNFTKHAIEALPVTAGRVSYLDIRVPGLRIQIEPTGTRTFFWYRKVRGRRTWRSIGNFPDLSVENARDGAMEFNTDVAKWKAKGYDGPSPFERHDDPTLEAVMEDYIAKRVRTQSKNPAKSEKDGRWMAEKYLKPILKRRLGQIRRQDVRQLHAELGAGKWHGKPTQVTANRAVKFVRTLFYWAIDTEQWHGENPARRIEMFAERSRDRFLQPSEAPGLFTALKAEPNKDLRDFVVVSLFTGARMGDVLGMRWQDIDGPLWRVPEPKNKVPYVISLMPEAIAILKERHAANGSTPWVFPSRGKTGHLVTVKKSWAGLLKRAKITDLHRHDLRRTLGSWMAKEGASLPLIGKALGHQSLSATQIYSRLDLAPVREAVATATKALLTAGEGKPAPKPRKRMPSGRESQ